MNYNNPELIERLSAEYVLGTLQGKARDRFEHLMENSHRIRLAVWNWENHISPMASAAPPVKAPLSAWPRIKQRISPTASTKRETWANRFWQLWGMTATATCLMLGIVVFQQEGTQNQVRPTTTVDSVAVFSNQDAQPQWLVSFDLDSGELKARALNDVAVETGRAFELWVLPSVGNPQSLGLLPVANSANATVANTLPIALIEILRSANGLAVSIEPEGGSPTGLPTGPVVYQSSILML